MHNDLMKICLELKNAALAAGDILIKDFKDELPGKRDGSKTSIASSNIIVSYLLNSWFASEKDDIAVVSGALILPKIAKLKDDSYILEDFERGIAEFTGSCIAVDSLCAKESFERGLRDFCISIAYLDNRQVKAAVVFDPIHVELFHAVCGLGAYMNGKSISASNTKNIIESCLSVSHRALRMAEMDALRSLLGQAMSIRTSLSAPIDMCYVACGRLDAAININLAFYEYAAGLLIANEAGVKLLCPDGGMLALVESLGKRKSIAATCPGIANDIAYLADSFNIH
ncbi:MAG: inositol monophosphatase family protein [Christensenellales bacterium]|jgi:fructose-1,6-bisphosphatase/inositol monophosphatase family enzyme